MKYAFATLALAASSLAGPVPETTPRAPTSFKITDVISGGSGCPQGSIDIKWTDNRIFPICTCTSNPTGSTHQLTRQLDFDRQFTAKVGYGKDVVESRKNCQINLKLEYDSGFSFSVYQADFAGWADLDTGVTGVVKSTYYFSGESDQVRAVPQSAFHVPLNMEANIPFKTSSALSLAGPFHGKYFKQDDVPLAVWSPCGKGEAMFNVNSEVYLTPISTAANGILASTREGGRLINNLYFQWRQC